MQTQQVREAQYTDALRSGSPHVANKPFDADRVRRIISAITYNSTYQINSATDIRDDYAKYGGVNAELLTIDLMEGHDFEYWCANVLKDMLYTNVEVTPGSGDQGVDILAEKNGIKYAIQCKRYSSDLGNAPVQEVHAGKYLYHCHIGAVITNRYFTKGAKELAEATGILLWDREWITNYLQSKASNDGSIEFNHSYTPASEPFTDTLQRDPMLSDAIDIIFETGQASVSMLQRRLKLGYARSAHIIDEMEQIGIVGPFEADVPRAILVSRAEWQYIKPYLKNSL